MLCWCILHVFNGFPVPPGFAERGHVVHRALPLVIDVFVVQGFYLPGYMKNSGSIGFAVESLGGTGKNRASRSATLFLHGERRHRRIVNNILLVGNLALVDHRPSVKDGGTSGDTRTPTPRPRDGIPLFRAAVRAFNHYQQQEKRGDGSSNMDVERQAVGSESFPQREGKYQSPWQAPQITGRSHLLHPSEVLCGAARRQ